MEKRLKADTYRKARGGYARFLDIFCEHCGQKILLYQKDGSGPLKRLYLDRIFSPAHLVGLQNAPINKVPNFICPKCKQVLGIPYVYPKEKRKAFRLFAGAITKKIAK